MRFFQYETLHPLANVGLLLVFSMSLVATSSCGNTARYSCVPFKRGAVAPGTTLTGGMLINPRGDSSSVGSMGGIVYDRNTGRPMVLTAGHVVYGLDADRDSLPPFPKGRQMEAATWPFGTVERGNLTLRGFTSSPPDVAVINIEDQKFDYNNDIIGIGRIGGVGANFVGQKVRYYNGIQPQEPPPSGQLRQNPIGIVYGTVTAQGLRNVDPRFVFSTKGNSGSIIVEDETNRNLAIALHYASNPQNGIADIQEMSYVLQTRTNPDTADARLYDPDKNPVAIFRYSDEQDGKQLLTTDWQELFTGYSFYGRYKKYENRRVLPSMLADARWNQLHDAHQAGATMDGTRMRST
jgi:hypothetical protein